MAREYPVITKFTAEEYGKLREKGKEPELAEFTRFTGRFYSERDIPRIVADAARSTSLIEEGERNPDWNMRKWPLEVKAEIMDAAHRNWEPEIRIAGPEGTGSAWEDEDPGSAEALFRGVPELRTALGDEEKALRAMTARLGA